MQVDFFNDNCKTSSFEKEFGLCDDPNSNQEPAYIDNFNKEKWIGIVKNSEEFTIDFFAIDNCIDLFRNDHKMLKRCDGLLKYLNNIIFVELKARKGKGGKWLNEARVQLKSTITKFMEVHDIEIFNNVSAHVCNKQKPYVNQGHVIQIQRFKDETGLILQVSQEIIVGRI